MSYIPSSFPESGHVRVWQIIGCEKRKIPPVIPVSSTSWWNGVKSGIYPKPEKLSPRVTVWKAQDIRALYETETKKENQERVVTDFAGFTLRDEVAMRVITSLTAREDQTGMNNTFIVKNAYAIADLVVAEHERWTLEKIRNRRATNALQD